MSDVKTIPTKHIFLDVVGFTSDRSVEAQAEIIYALNDIVRNSLSKNNVNSDHTILLPTGDGMDIVLLNIEDPYDIHIILALEILSQINSHNQNLDAEILNRQTPENGSDGKTMRKFEVRIGINTNVDNLITDINGQRNISGAGINMAQRIMNLADASQILIGQSVFETLRYREKYMDAFKGYSTYIKHEILLEVYHFQQAGHLGLNANIPMAFYVKPKESLKLSPTIAFYCAFLNKYVKFIIEYPIYKRDSLIILFWMWANDAVGYDEAKLTKPYDPKSPGIQKSIHEQAGIYESIPFYIIIALKEYISKIELFKFGHCFENGYYGGLFVNDGVIKKIETEYPEIVNKMNSQEWLAKFVS